MRETKFRGIANNPDVDHYGEWIYGDLIHLGGEVYIQNDDDAPDIIAIRVDPETVGQFTGLHDKNGKEIYRGDIVKYDTSPENGVATISSYIGNNLYFCWHNSPIPPTNADIFGCKDELEVIGNIHENPEIING